MCARMWDYPWIMGSLLTSDHILQKECFALRYHKSSFMRGGAWNLFTPLAGNHSCWASMGALAMSCPEESVRSTPPPSSAIAFFPALFCMVP